MAKKTLESLGVLVKAKRGERRLRETAQEVGVGPATLMRIENGHTPDIATLTKVCRWLGVTPDELLGFRATAPAETGDLVTISAHFRANKTSAPKTAEALASLAQAFLLSGKMQPEPKM
jgi:transcriptional regulator with XRE-family HTH domain